MTNNGDTRETRCVILSMTERNISIEGKCDISDLAIHANGGTLLTKFREDLVALHRLVMMTRLVTSYLEPIWLQDFYISVTSDLSPLDTSTLPAFLPAQYELPLIRPWEVCNKLLCLSPFKAIVTAFSAAGARPSNSTPLYRNGRSLTLVSHKEQNSGRSFS